MTRRYVLSISSPSATPMSTYNQSPGNPIKSKFLTDAIVPQLAKTQAELQKGKAEAAAYAKDARAATIKEIDKFDKKVGEKTAQAKSGVSSWFGGK